MSHFGEVSENPVTGERAIVLTDPLEHPDQVLVSHLLVEPGGRVATAHLHPNLRERFHVLSGRVGFRIGDEQRELGPGEEAEVPPNTIHDWWQVGDEPASVVVEVDPGLRFAQMVTTLFGLARDGKSTKQGLPKPLQLAVTVSSSPTTSTTSTPTWWSSPTRRRWRCWDPTGACAARPEACRSSSRVRERRRRCSSSAW